MASMKLSCFLLVAVALVLASQVEGGRRRNQNRGRGGRGRGGGRRERVNHEPEILLRSYSQSSGTFGLSVYDAMSNDHDNFAISPLSIHAALSMVLLGTKGHTKRELIRGLHIRTAIHQAFMTYNMTLDHDTEDSEDEEDSEEAVMKMANALYTRRGFPIKERYIRKLRRFYASSASQFAEGNPEQVINDWVSSKTGGMITDFLQDGELANAYLLLVNAIYFKGLWQSAFDAADTALGTFTDANEETHQIFMMTREGHYRTYHSSVLGATVLKMPYKGGRYSFNIILPDERVGLHTVEQRLNYDTLNNTLHALAATQEQTLTVKLPKFKMDTEKSLNSLLQALGINSIFSSSANFRKMTSSQGASVTEVKHRCVMELDEEGTEAAAVTSVLMSRSMAVPLPFEADRPFIFILRDDQTSVDLFIGRYVNPNGDNLEE